LALAGSPASLWVMVVDDGGCGVREAGGSRGQGSARADKKKKKKKKHLSPYHAQVGQLRTRKSPASTNSSGVRTYGVGNVASVRGRRSPERAVQREEGARKKKGMPQGNTPHPLPLTPRSA